MNKRAIAANPKLREMTSRHIPAHAADQLTAAALQSLLFARVLKWCITLDTLRTRFGDSAPSKSVSSTLSVSSWTRITVTVFRIRVLRITCQYLGVDV